MPIPHFRSRLRFFMKASEDVYSVSSLLSMVIMSSSSISYEEAPPLRATSITIRACLIPSILRAGYTSTSRAEHHLSDVASFHGLQRKCCTLRRLASEISPEPCARFRLDIAVCFHSHHENVSLSSVPGCLQNWEFAVPEKKSSVIRPTHIKKISATSCKTTSCADFGGERGIRTPGTSRYAGFQDRCNRPLYHLSKLSCG